MIEVQRILYECEFCGHTGSLEEIKIHEYECKRKAEEKQRNIEAYRKNIEERFEKATEWAKNSEPLKLLCSRGFINEAKLLCEEWSNSYPWDCGTSYGWEEVYREMIKAASESKTNEK